MYIDFKGLCILRYDIIMKMETLSRDTQYLKVYFLFFWWNNSFICTYDLLISNWRISQLRQILPIILVLMVTLATTSMIHDKKFFFDQTFFRTLFFFKQLSLPLKEKLLKMYKLDFELFGYDWRKYFHTLWPLAIFLKV